MALSSNELKRELESIQHEGWLEKESRILKTWRKRWCVLTPLYLLTFKEPHRYESPTECVSLQRIQGLGVCDQQTHRQWSFKIETDQEHFYLTGESNSQVQKWLGNIGNCLLKIRGDH